MDERALVPIFLLGIYCFIPSLPKVIAVDLVGVASKNKDGRDDDDDDWNREVNLFNDR